MNRIQFELLTTLSDGEWQTYENQYCFTSAIYRYKKAEYRKAVKDMLAYGLIERKDYSCPFDCISSELRITIKGYKALDVYEPLYYYGTTGAHDFMDKDFIGK